MHKHLPEWVPFLSAAKSPTRFPREARARPPPGFHGARGSENARVIRSTFWAVLSSRRLLPDRSCSLAMIPTKSRTTKPLIRKALKMAIESLDNLKLLTDGGLAEMLGVSVRTVQRLSARPGFPKALYVGRCRRWPKESVLEFFRQCERAGSTRKRQTPVSEESKPAGETL